MAHGTSKPCPGCGGEKYRSPKKVCDDCEGLLRVARAVKQLEADKKEKRKVFRIDSEWPSIYQPGRGPNNRRVEQAFSAVAKSSLSPLISKRKVYGDGVLELPSGKNVTRFSTYDGKATLWTGTKKLTDAITELDEAVREALQAAYNEGKKDGQALLMQLARGEVTVKELSDAHME